MVPGNALHLVKVPLRPDKLVALARRRQMPLPLPLLLDDGYLVHCLLRELWQERSPTPFVLRGRGRWLDVWGYSQADARTLIDDARAFADPTLIDAIDGLEHIASKEMPVFTKGRRLGFLLRACPVVRLAKARAGHRVGAEVDAFLARSFVVGKDCPVSREEVYRAWLAERLGRTASTGVIVERVGVAGFVRERLVRRTQATDQGQGTDRKVRRIERPDVHFDGEVVVEDGERFRGLLGHGIGRHRAFGFGALIVVPAGTTHAHAHAHDRAR